MHFEEVETEILPRVESQYHVVLSKDPDARATMGGSSGGSSALIMAWYRPVFYHRVLTYPGTCVNQQWPPNPQTPHGAWEFHEHLIRNSPGQADPPVDGGRGPRQPQLQRHERRDA